MANQFCLYPDTPRLSITGNGHHFVPRPVGNGRFIPRPVNGHDPHPGGGGHLHPGEDERLHPGEHVAAVDGRAFCHLDPSRRAVAAVDVLTGAIRLRMTVPLVAAAVGVSPRYVSLAKRLSDDERRDIRGGKRTLQQIVRPSASERFLAAAREIGTDVALELLAGQEGTQS
jgi:hypothetical protein